MKLKIFSELSHRGKDFFPHELDGREFMIARHTYNEVLDASSADAAAIIAPVASAYATAPKINAADGGSFDVLERPAEHVTVAAQHLELGSDQL